MKASRNRYLLFLTAFYLYCGLISCCNSIKVCCAAEPSVAPKKLTVIYIPGLFSFDDPQEDAREKLESIYPDAQKIESYLWFDSKKLNQQGKLFNNKIWEESVQLAEDTADEIFRDICKMSPEEQKNQILVGHSLGGRIVVRVLDKLRQKNLKIRQAILLGAAMDNNDPCIPSAVNASIDTVYSFVNPTDEWLTSSWAGVDRAMLGTGCAFYLDPKRFCEIQIDSTTSHDSEDYLSKFDQCKYANKLKQNCIIVPQEKRNTPEWLDNKASWTVVDSCQDKTLRQDWTLQKDKKGTFYVVDDLTLIRARGTEAVMKESFSKVKKQLEAGVFDGERESTNNFMGIMINLPSNKLVIKEQLGSSKELNWKNKNNYYYKGWRLQINTQTLEFRILDPSSHVRAEGSGKDQFEMEFAFKKLEKRLKDK